MTDPTYDHPLRGTLCVRGCPTYGYCHCGCGATTRVATSNSAPQSIVKGEPFVFRFRHRRGRESTRVYSPATGHSEKVATQPLRDLIVARRAGVEQGDNTYLGMQRRIAERTGITTRQVARWQKQVMENDTIAVEIADAMCVGLGVPFMFVYASWVNTAP